ncbi:MAG TPA: hypothetical protein VG318_09005 [Actinomycetota bacterium]|nr:hypothetical protein [Actinomycetota bacterium]
MIDLAVLIAGLALTVSILQWWLGSRRRPRFDADIQWIHHGDERTPTLQFTISNIGTIPGSIRSLRMSGPTDPPRSGWIPNELHGFKPIWLQVFETSRPFLVNSTLLVSGLEEGRRRWLVIEDARGHEKRVEIRPPYSESSRA